MGAALAAAELLQERVMPRRREHDLLRESSPLFQPLANLGLDGRLNTEFHKLGKWLDRGSR